MLSCRNGKSRGAVGGRMEVDTTAGAKDRTLFLGPGVSWLGVS